MPSYGLGNMSQERHQFRRLVKSVRESPEPACGLRSAELIVKVSEGGRSHSGKNIPGMGDHQIGTPIGERRGDQSGAFLIQRVVVTEDQFERIRREVPAVEAGHELVEAVPQNLTPPHGQSLQRADACHRREQQLIIENCSAR